MLGIITNSISYDLAYSLLDMWSLRSAVTSKPAASYIESQRSAYEKAINKAMDSVRQKYRVLIGLCKLHKLPSPRGAEVFSRINTKSLEKITKKV